MNQRFGDNVQDAVLLRIPPYPKGPCTSMVYTWA